MKRALVLLVLLVTVSAALGLSGCLSAKAGKQSLESHEWVLTKVGTSQVNGPADVTATFSAGKVTGSTGINRYDGAYKLAGDTSISISAGASTRASGTPAQMANEQTYLKALGLVASYAADEESLTLFDSTGNAVLTYKVLTPAPLVGTEWHAIGINTGAGSVASTLDSATVTAVFGSDSNLTGSGGINTYSGTYTASGSDIIIRQPSMTNLGGPDDIAKQENAYFTALSQAARFKIDGNTMALYDQNGAVLVIFRAK